MTHQEWEKQFNKMCGFMTGRPMGFLVSATKAENFIRKTLACHEKTYKAELRAWAERTKKLLQFTSCPTPDCDQHGTIYNPDGLDQCQWCEEIKQLLLKEIT